MQNALIVLLLVIVAGWAAWRTVHKFKHGGGCCGDKQATVKRTTIADRTQKHYPYSVTLSIGGMTCNNCARLVENALNALEGVWASVSISTHSAHVRLKSSPDEALLRQAVQDAGYVVLAYQVN